MTFNKLISLQETLLQMEGKPGIYVQQQYGRFSVTTAIQYDEVLDEDIPFVKDLYYHGMIRQLDCDLRVPDFMGPHLEPILAEQSYKVLTIYSDFPIIKNSVFKPISRIIKVHYDVIWANDLVAPEWTQIYDEEAYMVTLDGLPVSFLGIWTSTFDHIIDLPFLQVWCRNSYDLMDSGTYDSEDYDDDI